MTTSKTLSVRLPKDVRVALKVWCAGSGMSMQQAVTDAVRAFLVASKAGLPPVDPERPPVVRRRKGTPVAAPPSAESVTVWPPADAVCTRCGHPESAHWIKGCLAGCVCSAQRYRTTED